MPPLEHVDSGDFQTILADALTSFSPLATLVGAESARAFAQQVTNYKQTAFSAIGPLGALGMCATVCKASNIPGLKTMLGATDNDIYDAAADLGAYVLVGLIPQLTPSGGLNCRTRQTNKGMSPCGIVKVLWKPGQTDFEQLARVVTDFQFSMITLRACWDCNNADDLHRKATLARTAISKQQGDLIYSHSLGVMMFNDLEDIDGGRGAVELHWPCPSMSLETEGWIVWLALFLAAGAFATIAVITATALSWQNPIASALLLGGQASLALGQVCCHVFVKQVRSIPTVCISANGMSSTWTLVDSTWFVSALSRRRLKVSSSTLEISQSCSFSSSFIHPLLAIFCICTIIGGFVPFYVGARGSDTRTVACYIAMFVVVHASKGWILSAANRCYCSKTKSFAAISATSLPFVSDHVGQYAPPAEHHGNLESSMVSPVQVLSKSQFPEVPLRSSDSGGTSLAGNDENKQHAAVDPAQIPLPASEISLPDTENSRSVTMLYDSDKMPITSVQSTSADDSSEINRDPMLGTSTVLKLTPSSRDHCLADSHTSFIHAACSPKSLPAPEISSHCRLYVKTSIRHREGIDVFYYPRHAEFSTAAYIIYNSTLSFIDWNNIGEERASADVLCQIPIKTKTTEAILLLATDAAFPENVWWIAAQEITSILMPGDDKDRFLQDSLPSQSMFTCTDRLVSESAHVEDLEVLKQWARIVTRFILLREDGSGAYSMIRAISLAMKKREYNGSLWFVPELKSATQQAVREYTALGITPLEILTHQTPEQ